MTYYVSSPQLPVVFTFEDCAKSEVQAYIEDLMLGTSRRADNPEEDDDLEARGFVIKQEIGTPRYARRETLVESIEADDPDPSYIIDWARIACVSITIADPNPAVEHWERVVESEFRQSPRA